MSKNSKTAKTPYFTKTEIILWSVSSAIIIISFFLLRGSNYLTLTASLIGATSLILNAKGNPTGQVLMIVFSILYGIISKDLAYYGEMITYLGMTAPMALLALVSWLRNPYSSDRSQVKVNNLRKIELILMLILSAAVACAFYPILKYFNTSYLPISTVSVFTSFAAVYLTFRRSPLFALAYAANDAVLVILWSLACLSDMSYISVVVCFSVFMANDIYGFISWLRMKKRQQTP